MAGTLIGISVRRTEDQRLITGAGCFTDDIAVPGQVFACFVRSPHAHADIVGIQSHTARSMPGVLAVLTGSDYVADGLGGLTQYFNVVDHLEPSKPSFTPDELAPVQASLPIVSDRARHIGEIVAVVVAETTAAALDAAERVEVDYAPLPAVTDAGAAIEPSAPRVWDGGNICVNAENGDRDATEAGFARAHRVVRLSSQNHRICGIPMEPSSAIGEFDAWLGAYTLQAPSQGVDRYRAAISNALNAPVERVRVVTRDVGGGYGVRSACHLEYPLLLWAARRLARPVKWTASRSEAFLSDFQARDVFADGALALDARGRFLAAKLDYLANLGAHPISLAIPSNLMRMPGGPYDIPAMHVAVRGVFTNTIPVSVLRGAGRPEATFIIDRLIDLAAAELDIDRAALRRRNLVSATSFPYQSALGHSYDSGAFAENLDLALREIDWNGFAERRRAARSRGQLAGIAVANYLESPAGAPNEKTNIRVFPDGGVEAAIGTQSSGQGHETSFAQVVASTLEIPFERVSIVFGDTERGVAGAGSHSDRSMRLGGTVLVRAAEDIIGRGRAIASQLLEAATSDVGYAEGRFTVVGTDRSIGLFEVAEAALDPTSPDASSGPLQATSEITTRLHAHPNGVAACEVEVDPETGAVELMRYLTVDDVGRVINPMIVDGQIHGGIALGVGQALLEQSVYDADSGQLISGSFMDYCLPRADCLPPFNVTTNEVPTASNPLGVKGAGEAGTTPATAVVVGAIANALSDHGVEHIEMPVTPERIWRAMQAATA